MPELPTGRGLLHDALASVRTRRWYPAAGYTPILLWRTGLRPVIGLLFGLVSTRGRVTRATRHHLVTYRRIDGRTFLLGLYGRRSHWYRNLATDPRVTFQTAFSTRPMLARPLTDDAELLDVYRLLRRRSPVIFRFFYLWALGIRDDDADVIARRDRVTLVELRPAASDTAAPDRVRSDLVWVWPLLAGAWLLWHGGRRGGR